MLVAVYPLHKANPVRRIVVSTYQAASGAGAKAMAELEEQTAKILRGEKDVHAEALPQRIAFNLFPHVDVFLDNGYTKEEMKFVNESRKIMHHPTLKISATCVRVPVYRAHSEAVNIEFERPMTPGRGAGDPGQGARRARSWTIPPTRNIRCRSTQRACTIASWAGSGRMFARRRARASNCSSAAINCSKARRSMPCRLRNC